MLEESRLKLSVCIAVYNQLELVKSCLEELLVYQGEDIEILIGDDCSTENIAQTIDSLQDHRLRYIRNEQNLGHDLNIVSMLKKCNTNYAFVLRSRDKLFGHKIPEILKCIEQHSSASYFAFSALNENQIKSLSFGNNVYLRGSNAAIAHTKIFVHPSGNLYRISDLDFSIFEAYMTQYFDNNLGFTVHELIRIALADKGDFVTSSLLAWQYTQKAKDIAVNSAPNKISVYAPQYQYPRFECQFMYTSKESSTDVRKIVLPYLVRRFYKSIAFDFYYANNDPNMQYHYNYAPIAYSKNEERKVFRTFSDRLISKIESPNECKSLEFVIARETLRQLTWYPIKKRLISLSKNNPRIAEIARRYKHL